MKHTELIYFLDTFLRGKFVPALRTLGSSQGCGFYLRFYIFIWMMANADSLHSVEDTARQTGCNRDQVKLVWEFLKEKGVLEGDDGHFTIAPWMERIVDRITQSAEQDEIMSAMHLSRDEIDDLRDRLGAEYMLCLHRAADYKATLRSKNRPIRVSDYSLVLKAKDWIGSKTKQKVEDDDDESYEYEDDDDEITVLG